MLKSYFKVYCKVIQEHKKKMQEIMIGFAREERKEADAAFALSDYSTPHAIACVNAHFIPQNPYVADTVISIAYGYRKANVLVAMEIAELATVYSPNGSLHEKRAAMWWKRHVKSAFDAGYKRQAIGSANWNSGNAKPGSILGRVAKDLLAELMSSPQIGQVLRQPLSQKKFS
jgi:hypothetical protein